VLFGKFAIKFANSVRFTSGAELVDNTKLVATSFAGVIVIGDADGDGPGGAPPVARGVSSRLIVFLSTVARAGAWREFRLITPPRGVGVGVGVIGVLVGVGLGVGVGPYALVVNKSSRPVSGVLFEEKLSVLKGWSRNA
jgi:hypothetical protein